MKCYNNSLHVYLFTQQTFMEHLQHGRHLENIRSLYRKESEQQLEYEVYYALWRPTIEERLILPVGKETGR